MMSALYSFIRNRKCEVRFGKVRFGLVRLIVVWFGLVRVWLGSLRL